MRKKKWRGGQVEMKRKTRTNEQRNDNERKTISPSRHSYLLDSRFLFRHHHKCPSLHTSLLTCFAAALSGTTEEKTRKEKWRGGQAEMKGKKRTNEQRNDKERKTISPSRHSYLLDARFLLRHYHTCPSLPPYVTPHVPCCSLVLYNRGEHEEGEVERTTG